MYCKLSKLNRNYHGLQVSKPKPLIVGISTLSTTKMNAAAGGAGGSWYVLLQGLAALIKEVHPNIDIAVIEGGGVMNHSAVGSGSIPMAILNPPMTHAALNGNSPYDERFEDIRVGVTNLTTNYLHFAVDSSVPVDSFEGWCNSRHPLRIPVDRVGTVDRMVFRIALDHYGVSESDIAAWGGEAVPASNYDEQLKLYQDGNVNALWQFMGIPSPSMQAAHNVRPVKLLPFADDLIGKLGSMGWSSATLPAGAYGAVEEPTSTISMGTTLGFHASVSEDIAYRITKAICENTDRIHAIHPAAASFDPSSAYLDGAGPLHSGSERYYRESGLI